MTPSAVRRPAPRRTSGLVVSGSLRQDSHTRALAEALVTEQPWLRLGPSLDRLPFYDADIDTLATPAAVTELRDRVSASELLVIVTPDYDGAVPGLVGNAVDWLSRPSRSAGLAGRRVLVVSTGEDRAGGAAAGAALHERLVRVGAVPLAPPVAVPFAGELLAREAITEVVELADLAPRVRAALRADQRAAARATAAAAQVRRPARVRQAA